MNKRINHIIILSISGLFALPHLFGGMMGFPTLAGYEERAHQYGVKLTIPDFPGTVGEVATATDIIIANLNDSGDEIVALSENDLTFENTFRSLDLILHTTYSRVLPINIVKNTSTDARLREAAAQAMKDFNNAEIEFNYREDIYLQLKAFADTDPILQDGKQRLMDDMLLEYKRLGYDLPSEEREQAEALQKKVTDLATAFGDNIRNSNEVLTFTADELDGLTDSFLNSIQTEEGTYGIKPNVSHHVSTVYKFAKSEHTRHQVYTARGQRAMDSNIDVLKKLVRSRYELAQLLGYKTWADYRTENCMAKNGDAVVVFLNNLAKQLEPKFEKETASLLSLKIVDTENPEAVLNAWDISYYKEKQNQLKYDLDTEKLKQYFPYEKCVQGLFEVYETLFSIEIEEIENPTLWDANVALYVVSDTESEKPLGLFYIDPFPREGKFNHFAQFSIIPGVELADGTYQRPTVALICNFPPAQDNQPSLLSFDQVETLFHEFGHCMHSILTEAKYNRFSGTSVPRDFVETPSQVMEYWLQEKEVLDLFAADWKDQSKKLPKEWIEKIAESSKAHAAMQYRRQLSFGLLDMALHHETDIDSVVENMVEITNDIFTQIYLSAPKGTATIAGFGHLAGYDAGYYGYAWADVIAADFAQHFREAPMGFMDKEMGMLLRKEIFEVGNSRDINDSVQAFLGRKPEMDAFIDSLGIEVEKIEASEG